MTDLLINTGEILDDYARRDARVRIIHQENSGLTRALINGCAAATGEFIARQDAGDLSLAGRLARQLDVLKKRSRRCNDVLRNSFYWT